MSRDRQRQAKRDAAMARPELRQGPPYILVSHRLPDEGRTFTAYATDENGIYKLPFPVCRIGNHYFNAARQSKLEVEVTGWNYHTATPENQQ